jgi:hypothetical protein
LFAASSIRAAGLLASRFAQIGPPKWPSSTSTTPAAPRRHINIPALSMARPSAGRVAASIA